MPLLQAQLVQPDVGDHPRGIDLSLLGQLVLDDPFDRLGGDPQASGDFLRRAADQRSEHESLEAVGVGDLLALEGGDEVLAVAATPTSVEGGLVDPEAGLPPDVEVADRLGCRLELDVGPLLVRAALTAAELGQRPSDLEAVALLMALVGGDLDTWR